MPSPRRAQIQLESIFPKTREVFQVDNVDGSTLAQCDEPTFTHQLFNDPKSQDIVRACEQTDFIQGMVKGNLIADLYGGYTVQDAAYCYYAIPSFDQAADLLQLENPEFSLLYRRQAASFQRYNREFVDKWKLKGPDSVTLGEAAKTYVKYESAISKAEPKKLAIAMLPCTMLWPKIANDLGCKVHDGNPYKPWFDANKTDGSPSSLEKFIDFFFKKEKYEAYLHLFLEGMTNELNFFRSACGQDLYYYTKDFAM